MDQRVKVRIENRKVMNMKQGSLDKGKQGSEFQYGVTQCNNAIARAYKVEMIR